MVHEHDHGERRAEPSTLFDHLTGETASEEARPVYMNGTFWEPIRPASPDSGPKPNIYLAGVCLPLPIWLLTLFLLAAAIPHTVGDYRLAYGHSGVSGVVTLTEYIPASGGYEGTPARCNGFFQPTENLPEHRHRVEVNLRDRDCRIGVKLPASVCEGPESNCKTYAWIKGDGQWMSQFPLLFVAGPVWLLCTAVMGAFFFRWRRAVREAPNEIAQRPGTDGLSQRDLVLRPGMDDVVQRPGTQ